MSCPTPITVNAYTLRPEQRKVLIALERYVTHARHRQEAAWGRIVLPPRVGKTVIAAHALRRLELPGIFIVPTRALVRQTARLLQSMLPPGTVGTYFGEAREIRPGGVHVTTYSMLHAEMRRSRGLPAPLAEAGLVFCDEAHHTLTDERRRVLEEALSPAAVRIALTATPDYDERRSLCRFFPDLVAELTLEEAMDLDLVAPLRLWVAEVDRDASEVRIVDGDFDPVALGRLMAEAPFAQATCLFRYHGENRRRPALICCSTRQQAHDLRQYLAAHRPPGSTEPALLLGETPPQERERTLDDYAAGRIDTIVQVGVLIEGWSSERCKLLIDLAPSLSRVRATQKYFRVMTRQGDAEARIYVLLPKHFRAEPVLPIDMFGASYAQYVCGSLIRRKRQLAGLALLDDVAAMPVEGVALVHTIRRHLRLCRPELDATSLPQQRALLSSARAFQPSAPCNLQTFRRIELDHPLFRGRGDTLLRFLRIAPTRAAYLEWLTRLFPELSADTFLRERPPAPDALDRAVALDDLESDVIETALAGDDARAALDPEASLLRSEERRVVEMALATLPVRKRRILAWRYGLLGERAEPILAIAARELVSRGRVQQIINVSLRKLIKIFRRTGDGGITLLDPMCRVPLEVAPPTIWPVQGAHWRAMPRIAFDHLPRAIDRALPALGMSITWSAATEGEPEPGMVERFIAAADVRLTLRDEKYLVRTHEGNDVVCRANTACLELPRAGIELLFTGHGGHIVAAANLDPYVGRSSHRRGKTLLNALSRAAGPRGDDEQPSGVRSAENAIAGAAVTRRR